MVCCVVLKHLSFQLLLFHPSVLEPDLHLPGPTKTEQTHGFVCRCGHTTRAISLRRGANTRLTVTMGETSPSATNKLKIFLFWALTNHYSGRWNKSIDIPACHMFTQSTLRLFCFRQTRHHTQNPAQTDCCGEFHWPWKCETVAIWNVTTEDNLSPKNSAGGTFFAFFTWFFLVIFCPDGLCI